jgi:hypothetical protein
MPARRWIGAGGFLGLLAVVAARPGYPQGPARFDHAVHLRLFPGSCTTCHPGAADARATFWPEPTACRACHDGEVEKLVDWRPPVAAPPSNLRFTHPRHREVTADSVGCRACHTGPDSGRAVLRRRVDRCIACHQPGSQHLAVADRQCATCHLPLARATALPREEVAGFPVPVTHQQPGFALGGHGERAEATDSLGRKTVAASCATCHARQFCTNCHVNAPEVAAIQALAPDERSLVHRYRFSAPPGHSSAGFLTGHGREARRDATSCQVCHAQPSCTTCHVGQPLPAPVRAMHPPGPDGTRAIGARLERRPPASHVGSFREQHGRQAAARPKSCATCHVQGDCLSCHRGNAAQASNAPLAAPARSARSDYHPTGFLVRHPSAAYARQTTCADCHNTQQFCVSCHAQAGLNARRSLGSSTFHDGRAGFIVGHGQAARQSLESCVSCHVERDCTACHSSVGRGFRFSPHGPGFDPVRLRRRNPELCIACHGLAIPGGS